MTWDVCRGDLREIGKIIGNPEEESGLTDVLRRAATVPNGRGRKLVEAFLAAHGASGVPVTWRGQPFAPGEVVVVVSPSTEDPDDSYIRRRAEMVEFDAPALRHAG